MRISAAKQFGLIDGSDKHGLSVTGRGLAIVAPTFDAAEGQARLAAFMDVELFKKLYEKLNGVTLPSEAGMRNLLETQFGVVKDRVSTALRVLMDSAEQAGLFRAAGNRTRMVLPLSTNGGRFEALNPDAKPEEQIDDRKDRHGGGNGGGGGGSTDEELDGALLGVLRRLPPVGSRLSPTRRQAFIDAFSANLNVLYPEDDDL